MRPHLPSNCCATSGQVRAHYAEVFELVPELLDAGASGLELDFSGVDAAPEATDSGAPQVRIRQPGANRNGGPRLAGGPRAGDAFDARPGTDGPTAAAMLATLARQPQPDTAFNRFDGFLARQPAGVQLLSLFQRNPGLLDRVAAVLGAAPSLANHLARHPAALDGLLRPTTNPDPARLLRGRLQAMRDCSRTS